VRHEATEEYDSLTEHLDSRGDEDDPDDVANKLPNVKEQVFVLEQVVKESIAVAPKTAELEEVGDNAILNVGSVAEAAVVNAS